MGTVATAAATILGSVISAGASIYAANQAPDIQAGLPASYYSYDDDGNLIGAQEWDAKKHAYISRTYLTPEEKAEKEKMAKLRQQLLDNLDKTPEDRIKAYDEYAKAYSEAMHKEADAKFNELKTATEENMAKRGLYGSRAYVDSMTDLNREKMEADRDIANAAIMAREGLAQQDKAYWLQALNAMNNAKNADAAMAINRAQLGAQIASQGTAALKAQQDVLNSQRYLKWQQKANLATNLSDTASGLAFLYGYNKKK